MCKGTVLVLNGFEIKHVQLPQYKKHLILFIFQQNRTDAYV